MKNVNSQAVAQILMFMTANYQTSVEFVLNKDESNRSLFGTVIAKDVDIEEFNKLFEQEKQEKAMKQVLGNLCGEIRFLSKEKRIEIDLVNKFVEIEECVYPSIERTIFAKDDDGYGGAHFYTFKGCLGFDKEKQTHKYNNGEAYLQFVQKTEDGKVIAGVQTEQILIALKDRTKKLNAKFPCKENDKIIEGLQMAIDAHKDRVVERMKRDVMGDLKK